MTRHFSIPTMLRMTPNHLLRALFDQLEAPLLAFDWERCKERQIEPMLLAISWLPQESQARVELAFSQVFELATDSGWNALVATARELGETEFCGQFSDQLSPYARATLAWLRFPEIFAQASRAHRVEQCTRWHKRTGLPLLRPRIDSASLSELGAALSECLRREEGRGRHCTVEYVCRDDGTDVFIARPDDFAKAWLQHDQAGSLQSQHGQPTFDIVFAYHPERGTLELSGKVATRLKPKLENIFGQIILGADLATNTIHRPFDLNRLKDRYFSLETDPLDELNAEIVRLRFWERNYGLIQLEPRVMGADLYGMIEDCLNHEVVNWDDVEIQQTTFRFEFASSARRKAGTLSFDVAAPAHCNIRSRRPDLLTLTHKYLRRWRIANV